MTSRWTVDTVAWLLNDVARKRRGNGCGMRLAHARVRLPSEPIFISFYMEWRYRRHPMSARGLRTCSHVWRTDEIPGVSSLPQTSFGMVETGVAVAVDSRIVEYVVERMVLNGVRRH